ncbi:MAG: indolepyruvate oxidoreductase subunit beta [Raoultibacter sp.]|jgi:indolepyruvate ferredoxin oxidoreductase beta subunit
MSSIGNDEVCTVLLCGVGGQGTILAADLLAHCAMAKGLEVKLSEVHGMAQRGGAVTTVVRFGKQVSSMVTDPGCADYVLAFETTEALRNEVFLKTDGVMIVNDEAIQPLPVLTGLGTMPERVGERLAEVDAHVIPAITLAEEAGNIKAVNVVLLGVLASFLSFEEDFWLEQIKKKVPPKTIEVNLKAFKIGLEHARATQD